MRHTCLPQIGTFYFISDASVAYDELGEIYESEAIELDKLTVNYKATRTHIMPCIATFALRYKLGVYQSQAEYMERFVSFGILNRRLQ